MTDIFERILLLKRSSVFSKIQTEDLQIVAQSLELASYSKGDRIFDIDDDGDLMYIIQQGCIGISTHNDPTIREFIVTLKAGDCFGEMNLLDELPRSATAHVIEDAALLCLHKEKLHGLIVNYPELSLGILKSLSIKLRETTIMLQQCNSELEK
ncbi:MAG: cyclic nucleotide-binding domain-containing protein [Gammaproteobacteria bacterium]|nr:cyclic nucleotide-binding domain-containing protein [Gammaproteobacteria bacterium]